MDTSLIYQKKQVTNCGTLSLVGTIDLLFSKISKNSQCSDFSRHHFVTGVASAVRRIMFHRKSRIKIDRGDSDAEEVAGRALSSRYSESVNVDTPSSGRSEIDGRRRRVSSPGVATPLTLRSVYRSSPSRSLEAEYLFVLPFSPLSFSLPF